MKIDSDLMDGDMIKFIRETTELEDQFLLNFIDTSAKSFDYTDISEALLLGRQYERNQQKDDGK